MFRDLYRSHPHFGMIYVAMKSLRSAKLLWWKLPADPAHGSDERIAASEVPDAIKHQAYKQLHRNRSIAANGVRYCNGYAEPDRLVEVQDGNAVACRYE